MTPALLVMDFDGTLADTGQAIAACMRRTFARFKRQEPPWERIRSVIGMGLGQSLQTLCPALSDAEVLEWIPAYRECSMGLGVELTRLYPGVVETLGRLREAGHVLAVLSNKGQAVLEASLQRVGLEGMIALASGDRPGRLKKPDPGLFAQELRPAFPGLKPEDLLVVGDGEQDTAFAQGIGAQSCWAAYGYGDAAKCLRFSPRWTIANFAQLADLLGAKQGEGHAEH